MSSSWQSVYRTLKKQFLKAGEKDYRVCLAIASFPRCEAYDAWYKSNVSPELHRFTIECHRDAKSVGTIWGDSIGVDRYVSLATEAGNSLPMDFYPPARLFSSDPLPVRIQAHMAKPVPTDFQPTVRLFRHWNELDNLNPSPITVWEEFLYVAQCCQFSETEDDPEWGSRVARLDKNSNPFRVSALAIDRFLLADPNRALGEYHETMRSVCDWIKFPAPVAHVTPARPSSKAGSCSLDELLSRADALESQGLEAQRHQQEEWAKQERFTNAVAKLGRANREWIEACGSAELGEVKEPFDIDKYASEFYSALLKACRALSGNPEALNRWCRIEDGTNDEANLTQYSSRSTLGYQAAKTLIGHGLGGLLTQAVVVEVWQRPKLRDTLAWLLILFRGLAGDQIIHTRLSPPESRADQPEGGALLACPIEQAEQNLTNLPIQMLATPQQDEDRSCAENAKTAEEKVGEVLNTNVLQIKDATNWVSIVAKSTGLKKGQVWRTKMWQDYQSEAVGRWLVENRSATGTDVRRVFGFHPSKKENLTSVWAAHLKQKKDTRQVKERPLSVGIMQSRPDERAPEPIEQIDQRDLILQIIRDGVDQQNRGLVNGLSRKMQNDLVEHILRHCDVQDIAHLEGEGDKKRVLATVAESWLQTYSGEHPGRVHGRK